MIHFHEVQVSVDKGSGTYHGTVTFERNIDNAQVALRGLNLPNYTNGDRWHYRGPTIVSITNVNTRRNEVQFDFTYNVSENNDLIMTGAIDFLVIAVSGEN